MLPVNPRSRGNLASVMLPAYNSQRPVAESAMIIVSKRVWAGTQNECQTSDLVRYIAHMALSRCNMYTPRACVRCVLDVDVKSAKGAAMHQELRKKEECGAKHDHSMRMMSSPAIFLV